MHVAGFCSVPTSVSWLHTLNWQTIPLKMLTTCCYWSLKRQTVKVGTSRHLLLCKTCILYMYCIVSRSQINFFMLYTFSLEYVALLSAIFRKPLPLAIAMTTNVLPLSHRPQYSRAPPPLRMWYVTKDDSGERRWYPFQGRGLMLQNDIESSKPPAQKVNEFIERLHYPIIVRHHNVILREKFNTSSHAPSLSFLLDSL